MFNINTNKEEINQLYHPLSILEQDSQQLVYSQKILNYTKFVPILLKEWFYLVREKGYMVIDYKASALCGFEELESMMKWLWQDKYEIVFHGEINESEANNFNEDRLKEFLDKNTKTINGNLNRFVCKKLTSTKNQNDDISKWTFGVITNGKREDWVEEIVESIRKQKIPNYEIIICGTYKDKREKDIKYIPFNKFDDKGWITRKKNLIVKNAKYENICMMHDRIVLGDDWYKGMKKWGNCFENLGCRQLFKNVRVHDWVVSHFFIKNKEGDKFSFESYVDYRDWYPDIWFLGQLNIFKKSIIVKNNLWWDEKLFYGEREDYQFSKNLHQKGFIHRFNNYSSVTTLTNKYVKPTYIKYESRSLNPNMKIDNLSALLKLITFLVLKLFSLLGLNLSYKQLEKARGKIYTLIRLKKIT